MPKTTYHQFKLRLQKGLFDRLDDASKSAKRSVSAEMIGRLEDSFHGRSSDLAMAVQDAVASFPRSSLPQAEWGAKEFSLWPGRVSLGDFTLFFALLAKADAALAAQLHEACLQHKWMEAEVIWRDKVVPMLGGPPETPQKRANSKPDTAAPTKVERRRHQKTA